ncbi:tetratricopeptide repeat protein [Singulisphaera sp. PoT]|uniref:tetratricopeptide repeat protein n=1 Tax=Singulisphaera sp. PoT TaxID=3411797 RepID=UPI003BF5DE3B
MTQPDESPKADRTTSRSADAGRSEWASSSDSLDPALLDLVEEFSARILAGEGLDFDTIAREHPECAEALRELMPAMLDLAELGRIEEAAKDEGAGEVDDDEPRVFGGFRIVREVGRGGMGIVYEAEQVALKRFVALKVLPAVAALDPRALKRFELEAQVAGWLQHPRIVPVHDVGIVDRVPYYSMQFIEGGSLADLIRELRGLVDAGGARPTDQGDENGLSTLALGLLSGRFAPPRGDSSSGRTSGVFNSGTDFHEATGQGSSIRGRAYFRTVARLGMQAADALAYAHEQGIVHRDIKPANLLLDPRGELWVADFGMADVQGDAGVTQTGDMPGTLRYMSPEQARGKRALVDRRTDLYSLGATLYELLTLRPAVVGEDRQDILRCISEEEPTPIRRINPAVPVDLATILSKAMAKDPLNRYETARHLADDLERFLDGRPISARPVGPLVRAWRWSRRKPMQAGLAAGLAAAIVVGFAGITWSWREAVHQKRLLQVAEADARRQAAKADAINRFLIEGLLIQAEPSNSPVERHVTLLEVLDRASQGVGTSFASQPEIEATIRLAIGRIYHGLGEFTKSESHFRAAGARFEQLPGATSPGLLEARSELGHILSHLGRDDEAEPLLVKILEKARDRLGLTDPITLRSAEYLASVHRTKGRLAEAESLYLSYLADARRATHPDQDIIFSALFNLGDVYLREGKTEDAESLYRKMLDEERVTKGPKHPSTLSTMNNLGATLNKQKKHEEAERIFRECARLNQEVRGRRHPDTATAMYNLGHVLIALGRYAEAEPLVRESIESRRATLGDEHPGTLYLRSGLGNLLRAQGRFAEAEDVLKPCLEAQVRILGSKHPETVITAKRMSDLQLDQSKAKGSDSHPPRGIAER